MDALGSSSTDITDLVFIDNVPDDLKCSICLSAAMDAVVTEECGHLFCRVCITQALQRKKECPIDRQPCLPEHIHKDVRTRRKINELKVQCPHNNNGCTWEGLFGDAEKHLSKCEFTAAVCPFESQGCSHPCSRKTLVEHLHSATQSHLLCLATNLTRLQEDILVMQQNVEIMQRQDKCFVWVIPNFETRRGALYSVKFSQRGYLWYMGVDSEGPDQHAGVYLFAEGHTKRVDYKLTLYNADDSKDKVHMVSDWRRDYKGKGWGPLKFVDRTTLPNSGFLVNGSLRIGLKMETDPYD